jgi:hypothetical protein
MIYLFFNDGSQMTNERIIEFRNFLLWSIYSIYRNIATHFHILLSPHKKLYLLKKNSHDNILYFYIRK